MTLQPSVATPQYTKLRSPSYAGDGYVTLFSDRVVFQCELDTNLTSAASWAQFNYTNVTVGAYTDVEVDMEVFISQTSNIKESTFIGRVRLAPTSSVFYTNESSLDFSIGATIFVLYNFVPMYRLSRPSTNDPATAVELVDYDQTFQQLAPQTVGLQTAYIGNVSTTTGDLRLGFDASASYPATSGATLSTFAWDVGAGTIIAGSGSAQRIIVDFPSGEHWPSLTITDSGGRTSVRHFAVRAHSDDDPPNVYGSNISITGSIEQGWTGSVPFFAGVDDVLPNAFGIFWRDYEAYGNSEGNLWGGGSATITNKARTTNVSTLTAVGHPFQAGQQVIIITNDTTFNGTFTITTTTTNTFSYAQTAGNVSSAAATGTAVVNPQNVDFVGWWQQEDDPVTWDSNAAALEAANFQFTGVGARMTRMASQLLGFTLDGTPTLWGEIVNLTPWRAMLHYLQRYTTIANLCDITFDSTDNTYLFPALSAQGGNAMESVRGIARQIRANPEFAPWGAIQIVTEVGQLDSVARAALPTIAAWDMQDIISPGGITRSIEPIPAVGKVDADGGGYNTTLGQVIVYTARAPGIAQGEGSSSATLSAQIMPASATSSDTLLQLRQYVGNQLLIENNQEYLDVDHPDGYVGVPFIPSKAQLYTWMLDADMVGENNVNRIVYTTAVKWVVENVAINYNSEGLRTIKVRYHRVTPIGALGDDTTQIIPAPGEIAPLPDPGLPGFEFEPIDILYPDEPVSNALPPLPNGNIATFKGQELIVTSPSSAWWLQNFVTLATPTALNITPSDLDMSLVQPAISPFYTDTTVPAVLLGSDATDSAVWYASNAATLSAVWTKGSTTPGEYTVLRMTSIDGSLLMYAPAGTALADDTGVYDFSTGNTFDWEPQATPNVGPGIGNFGPYGVFMGTYWESETHALGGNGITLYKPFASSVTLTAMRLVGTTTAPFTNNIDVYAFYGGAWHGAILPGLNLSGSFDITIDLTGASFSAATKFLFFGSSPVGAYTWTISLIELTATEFPIADGITVGSAGVAYSTDNGATWDSAASIGGSPGDVGGFDMQRSGGNSFGAANHVVTRATSIGGSYTDYYTITGGASQAVCIVVPYFNWAGTKQTSATNPDIIVALDVADGSSRTLLWIEGGATPGTVHDITPVAGITFDNANCVTTSYNHHIAVTGLVSGVYRLYVTYNRGSSWSNISSLTNPTQIRSRRNDNSASVSGSLKGQLFMLANGTPRYSSKWASNGTFTRTPPTTGLLAFDTVY